MDSGTNNKANVLDWLENIIFKIFDSMKIISETSVNIMFFVMFCAVLSYIAWGKTQPVKNNTECKSTNVDTVKDNVDSIKLKSRTR